MTKEEQEATWMQEQRRIATQVKVVPDEHAPQGRFSRLSLCSNDNDNNEKSVYVGGVDVSYSSVTNSAVAVYVIIQTPSMHVVYEDSECFEVEQPYIPSFLAFRELDPLQRLIEKQTTKYAALTPRVLLVDGNGILHPRGAGLACALGVATDLPTVGVGKTLYQEGRLTKDVVWRGIDMSLKDATHFVSAFEEKDFWVRDNECISSEQKHKGIAVTLSSLERRQLVEELISSSVPSIHSKNSEPKLRGLAIPMGFPSRGIVACAVLAHGHRQHPTQTPIFVSVGHLISLECATRWVIALSVQSRIPEPLRQADLRGRALLRAKERL